MTANASSPAPPSQEAEPKGVLGLIVQVGNKIPDITTLFVSALVIVLVVSALLS